MSRKTQSTGSGTDQVLQFTQQAGDIVLLPDNWGHATLNSEASIGAVFIFDYCDSGM